MTVLAKDVKLFSALFFKTLLTLLGIDLSYKTYFKIYES